MLQVVPLNDSRSIYRSIARDNPCATLRGARDEEIMGNRESAKEGKKGKGKWIEERMFRDA